MSALSRFVGDFARRPDDSDELAFSKKLILLIALSCCACGLLWSATYVAVFGVGLVAGLPLVFVGIVGATIVVSARIRDHRPLIYAQLTCITWVTAFIQWTIGSTAGAGLVISWAFLAPIGALIFLSLRQAIFWMAMFLGIVVVSAAFEPALLGAPLPVSRSRLGRCS